ncbi:uncharacterized protein LOC111699302 [Eurytemora carolleeae]|uniref:uncharacterized protein LOC111699302 n=1 Tax=Eurytemora carolleeae TaxID=1294199 RepID=UPI000C7610D0|nr:uncharacterized protein LOC111699302 [Eurytemora carolleeae]|eukprot:XP_023325710.1 uncharacterized protein LOC111699302 [Eurytemora affinis]
MEEDLPPPYESLIPKSVADKIAAKPKKFALYSILIVLMIILVFICIIMFTFYNMKTDSIASKLDGHVEDLLDRIQRLDLREGQNTADIASLTLENTELKNKLRIMNENIARIASEQDKNITEVRNLAEKLEIRTRNISRVLETQDENLSSLSQTLELLRQVQVQLRPGQDALKKVQLLDLGVPSSGSLISPCTYVLYVLVYMLVHTSVYD